MRTAHRREALRVGDLAKAAGLTVEGVRYYERQGLLDRPARSQAGYRLYPPEALVRLQFIRQAKAVGLSLAEIRQVLKLSQAGVRPCQEVRTFMQGKLAEVERTLKDLTELRRRLLGTLAEWNRQVDAPTGAHVCALIEGSSPSAMRDEPTNDEGARRRSTEQWRSRRVKSTSAPTRTAGARSK